MNPRDVIPLGDDDWERNLFSRDLRRALRRRSRTGTEIYLRQLEIDKLVEFDHQDTEGTGDALEFAFKKETDFLNDIRQAANGDRAALELGASKLNAFSSYNNRRAARRFGRL